MRPPSFTSGSRLCRLACLLLAAWSLAGTGAAQPVLVAVASNMNHAFTEIAEQFHRDQGGIMQASFGSSGNFTRQILQGAPYDLFLSADGKYVDMLRDQGARISAARELARGRIGVLVPTGSSLDGIDTLEGIMRALQRDQYRRIAIANPEHAPYGLAARQALQRAGVWVIDGRQLLLGESAAQALQFTLSGEVDAGLVPTSYAILPEVSGRGRFFLIPEHWHDPIRQYLVLLETARSGAARRAYDYLFSPAAAAILARYGYVTAVDPAQHPR